jgi:hypothetical protein
LNSLNAKQIMHEEINYDGGIM